MALLQSIKILPAGASKGKTARVIRRSHIHLRVIVATQTGADDSEVIRAAMTSGGLVLVLVAIAGVLGKNHLIAIAALTMIVLQLVPFSGILPIVERHGISLGIFMLTIGLLLPFATGKLGLAAVSQAILTRTGFVSIVVGAIASYLGAGGLHLLSASPQAMIGLIIGTILGVSLLGGIPTGPIVAAGIAAAILKLIKA